MTGEREKRAFLVAGRVASTAPFSPYKDGQQVNGSNGFLAQISFSPHVQRPARVIHNIQRGTTSKVELSAFAVPGSCLPDLLSMLGHPNF